MKRRFLSIISFTLITVMLLSVGCFAFPAFAQTLAVSETEEATNVLSGSCGTNVNWELNKETGVLRIYGEGDMYDYDFNIDFLGGPWVRYDENIITVVIEEGVTSIGACAFYGCTSMTGVEIPQSVTTISHDAFACCYVLESIEIPSGVTTIGNNAFAECRKLKTITIPKSVTKIGAGAFYSCPSLVSITVDSENEFYSSDEYGVLFDKSKSTLIKYPSANERTSYTVPDSVENISGSSFSYSENLKNIIIADSVKRIGDEAFAGCDGITEITIPESVEEIGSWAFHFCEGLTSIVIPNGVQEINNYSFSYCSGLGKVYIPKSIMKIWGLAFNNSKNLKEVYYEGTEEEWLKLYSKSTGPNDATVYFNHVHSHSFLPETQNPSDNREVQKYECVCGHFYTMEKPKTERIISVSSLPSKTSYKYKEKIDLSGVKLKITAADGSVEYVTDTSLMTVTSFDSSKIGVQTVTVNYEQYSFTYEVEVRYSLWQWIIRILFLGFLWH